MEELWGTFALFNCSENSCLRLTIFFGHNYYELFLVGVSMNVKDKKESRDHLKHGDVAIDK